MGIILPTSASPPGLYRKRQHTIDENQLRKSLAEPRRGHALLTQTPPSSYSQYNTAENKEHPLEESGLYGALSDIVKNNISKVGKKGP
jgi:hypothetical protein